MTPEDERNNARRLSTLRRIQSSGALPTIMDMAEANLLAAIVGTPEALDLCREIRQRFEIRNPSGTIISHHRVGISATVEGFDKEASTITLKLAPEALWHLGVIGSSVYVEGARRES